MMIRSGFSSSSVARTCWWLELQSSSLRKASTVRGLATKPWLDPLRALQQECMDRRLCDESGGRLAGVHWVMAIAIPHEQVGHAPNLRTVGVQRVSTLGIDFVTKRGTPTATYLERGSAISILHNHGQYLPGESAEQWRAEGPAVPLLLEQVVDRIPHYTITSILASKRIQAEKESEGHVDGAHGSGGVSEDRGTVPNKSHFTEVMQTTRIELENGDISMQEMEECISAFRFKPRRVECMMGGPDSITWERWEWLRENDTADEVPVWKKPNLLLPH